MCEKGEKDSERRREKTREKRGCVFSSVGEDKQMQKQERAWHMLCNAHVACVRGVHTVYVCVRVRMGGRTWTFRSTLRSKCDRSMQNELPQSEQRVAMSNYQQGFGFITRGHG